MNNIHPAMSISPSLFSSVKYILTGSVSSYTESLLEVGGGRRLEYPSSLVTHCIAGSHASTHDITQVQELLGVPVVTEEWVTASVRSCHILPVRGFSTSSSMLFSGITLVLDQDTLSLEDCMKVWAMVTWYGGRVVKSKGTHLVSGRWQRREGENIMAVTPDWVEDSVKDRRLKDAEEYHPSYLVMNEEEDKGMEVKVFDNASVVDVADYNSSRACDEEGHVAIKNTFLTDEIGHLEATEPCRNNKSPLKYKSAVCKNRILSRKKRVQYTKEQRTVKEGEKLQTIIFFRLVKEIVTEQLGGEELRFQVGALCALEEAAVLYSEGILENSNLHVYGKSLTRMYPDVELRTGVLGNI